jgi:hypothetical protein
MPYTDLLPHSHSGFSFKTISPQKNTGKSAPLHTRYSDELSATLFPIPYTNEEWRPLQRPAMFRQQNRTNPPLCPPRTLREFFLSTGVFTA